MRTRICIAAVLSVTASPALSKTVRVATQAEYAAIAAHVSAGDVIVLANGEWHDFEVTLSAQGTAAAPIVLKAEQPGRVVLTGRSNLRIGGSHIVVSGLIFRNGYSPTGEVLSFRVSKDNQAHDSRITEVVIDGFSKPDRYEDDYWIGMYGRNNRFDHNYIAGKTNKGVTLAVRLDTEDSRQNHHRIDHNYFGVRPVLGSNGGETIRVGTSQYSMHDSLTLIERNYFEHCDGEVEILSIKSGRNVVRENVFDASQGAVTLRHGDGNTIERNVFLGRGKAHTGGIRVINRGQVVRGNYMEGIRGTGFASALTVMNGVPNSPINRYVQVVDATIANNTIIDASRITLGAGADTERSAPPIRTIVSDNLLGGTDGSGLIEIDADLSGIAFRGNVLMKATAPAGITSLRPSAVALERAANGLLYPVDPALASVGAPRDLQPVARSDTGPSWFDKRVSRIGFGTGRTIAVSPGPGSLEHALTSASAGDVLALAPGRYVAEKTLFIDAPVTIAGPVSPPDAVIVSFQRPFLFEIREGGDLKLAHLSITGDEAPDNVGNAVIRTSATPMRGNFTIEMDGVDVHGLTVNRGFDVIKIGKNAFAQSVVIRGSRFADISGAVVRADAETDDYGQYSAENVRIVGSTFDGVRGGIADFYRGGRDESTFGPHFELDGSTIADSGDSKADPSVPVLRLHGVQDTHIAGNTFTQSTPIRIVLTVGEPRTRIDGNTFDDQHFLDASELVFKGAPRVETSGNTVEGSR